MRNPLRLRRRSFTAEHDLRARAEALAAQLPPIGTEHTTRWRARFGQNPSRRPGPGDQFWQYRRYQPGDAASVIDWRKSATSEHMHVREREFETAERYVLWCDASPSMDYAGPATNDTKGTVAAVFALTLTIFLGRSREHVELAVENEAPPPAALDDMAAALAAISFDGPSLPPPAGRLTGDTTLILIGDFLSDPGGLNERLKSYGMRGITGVLVHLFDPAEETLPFKGHINFRGLEDEGTTEIEHVGSVREAYRARFEAHRETVGEMARRAGWTFLSHRTDAPPLPAMTEIIEKLAENRETAA